jgi:hypothetical protein
MTREDRQRIREAIDQATRQQLTDQEQRVRRNLRRATSYQRYYWAHRDEILARRAAKRTA